MMIGHATELLQDLNEFDLWKHLIFFPDDAPQVAEYAVEEIGESSENMERKSQWQRVTKETGLLKEASRVWQG